MFLNLPHSTHRYYGELLKAYSNQLFINGSLYEPYYISSYFTYRVGGAIKGGLLHSRYAKFKYHIVCAIRALSVGRDVLFQNSRKMKKQCATLMEIINNEPTFNKLLQIAVSCLDETVRKCTYIPYENLHRSREVTDCLLEIANEYTQVKNSTHYLKRGDVVTCVVNSIKDYYISVDIKSDDERNYGQIHISKIAKKYISDIREEVRLSQIFQAKIINDDFYESRYGWELSMILD